MADKTDPIVDAQHDETGRMWRGPLSQLPRRYAVLPVAELQALRAENARLRDALTWYVEHGAWPVELVRDGGETARAALAGEPPHD
jgi:hypothetical protein